MKNKLQLPKLTKPIANYLPYVSTGNTLYISGQLPLDDGKLAYQGKLGLDISIEDAQSAARLCALNLLAQLNEACEEDLSRAVRCVKLVVFVASTPDFIAQPQVANAASDLIVEVFGEHGKHARSAVGVSSLPLNAPVEVEGIFEIKSLS